LLGFGLEWLSGSPSSFRGFFFDSRWYTLSCRILEVLAALSVFAFFAAAFAYMGTDAPVWAFREKLI